MLRQKNVVDIVDVVLLNIVLLLLFQIYYHAKSGGPSFKIDWVMAISGLAQILEEETHRDRLTDFTVI